MTNPTVADVQVLIDRAEAEIADLRAHGIERMSKTGVKWSIEVNRGLLKRLRKWKAELQVSTIGGK